jgi:dihydrofolate synthase/folylpolyglutamate synthase
MNYQQTLDYLFSQLPMFHRIGPAAYKPSLENTLKICKVLGNPQQKFRSVHVAGTNGKGSVSHMIASVLMESGLKTGLYTSPHLKDFRERIRISGRKIPRRQVIRFVCDARLRFEGIDPSFFEYTAGMAFHHFAEEKVDIAVLETGMGGRLDSTNIVTPVLSVITNISLDHTAFLGSTPEEIAREKAGIIKPGIPVVVGEKQAGPDKVFIGRTGETRSAICFADDLIRAVRENPSSSRRMPLYRITGPGDSKVFMIKCPLRGEYQLKNIRTAVMAIEVLKDLGFRITDHHLAEGIRKVVTNTGIRGRWQVAGHRPLVVFDVGHNEAGIMEVLSQLSRTEYRKLHWVLGVVSDKDIDTMISLLPSRAIYYFCRADIPRGMEATALMEKAKAAGLSGLAYPSVRAAFEAARDAADADDMVLVAGSTFTVAELF